MFSTLNKQRERNGQHCYRPVSGSLHYMDSTSSDISTPTRTPNPKQAQSPSDFTFRCPDATDGAAVFQLVRDCKPLDENSMYCNLLQCSHFSSTSIAAEANGQLAGFISGYRLPEQPDTLFVWQVAVHPDFRGKRLATQMLETLLRRIGDVHYLHTTITPDNLASWNTFRRLAQDLGATLNSQTFFDKDAHFGGVHDSEELVVIGPF